MLRDQVLREYSRKYGLSRKQTEILQELILRPHDTSNQLAENLACSAATLNVHIANIMQKVGFSSRRELIQHLEEFIENGTSGEGFKPLKILFADDDPVFRDRVVAQINKVTGNKVEIQIFDNGLELLMHLARANPSSPEYIFPDIILLDLVMPTMDGMKTLSKIKEEDRWSDIPVIVFSSSAEKGSINSSYAQGANSYIVKPSKDGELERVIKLLLEYWGKIGSSPERKEP